jgi:hypothetical protein
MTRLPPSPREIRQRAREVRATWSPRQRWSRAGKPSRRWSVPVAARDELAAAAGQMRAEDRAASEYGFERAASES